MSRAPRAASLAQHQPNAFPGVSEDRKAPGARPLPDRRASVVPDVRHQDHTSVRVREQGRTRRRLIYGLVTQRLQLEGREHQVLLPPDRLAGYLVTRDRARALFFFRTGSGPLATTVISGVHPKVRLLFVASTARSVIKATNSLRHLARVEALDVDSLPDGFWLRLADFVQRPRPRHILPEVDALLRQQRRGP